MLSPGSALSRQPTVDSTESQAELQADGEADGLDPRPTDDDERDTPGEDPPRVALSMTTTELMCHANLQLDDRRRRLAAMSLTRSPASHLRDARLQSNQFDIIGAWQGERAGRLNEKERRLEEQQRHMQQTIAHLQAEEAHELQLQAEALLVLREELRASTHTIEELQAEIGAQASEISELKTSNEELRSRTRAMEELQVRVARQATEMAELKAANARLRTQADGATDELTNVRGSNDRLRDAAKTAAVLQEEAEASARAQRLASDAHIDQACTRATRTAHKPQCIQCAVHHGSRCAVRGTGVEGVWHGDDDRPLPRPLRGAPGIPRAQPLAHQGAGRGQAAPPHTHDAHIPVRIQCAGHHSPHCIVRAAGKRLRRRQDVLRALVYHRGASGAFLILRAAAFARRRQKARPAESHASHAALNPHRALGVLGACH